MDTALPSRATKTKEREVFCRGSHLSILAKRPFSEVIRLLVTLAINQDKTPIPMTSQQFVDLALCLDQIWMAMPMRSDHLHRIDPEDYSALKPTVSVVHRHQERKILGQSYVRAHDQLRPPSQPGALVGKTSLSVTTTRIRVHVGRFC